MSLAKDNIETTLITDSAVLAMMSRVNKVCACMIECMCVCVYELFRWCATVSPPVYTPGHNWDSHSAGRRRVSKMISYWYHSDSVLGKHFVFTTPLLSVWFWSSHEDSTAKVVTLFLLPPPAPLPSLLPHSLKALNGAHAISLAAAHHSVPVRTYTHTHTDTLIHMHTYKHTHMHTYKHTHMHTRSHRLTLYLIACMPDM